MKNQNYKIGYTRRIGGKGEMIVTSQNKKDALINAKFNCHTGKDFYIIGVTDKKALASNKSQSL